MVNSLESNSKPAKIFIGCVTYAKDSPALPFFLDSLAAFTSDSDVKIDWDLCFVDTSRAGCPDLAPYTQLHEECKKRLPGRKVTFLETTVAPGLWYIEIIARARQQLQQEFLKHPDYTHFLMVDSDMIFPADTLQALLSDISDNHPVVTGVYLSSQLYTTIEGVTKFDIAPMGYLKDPVDVNRARPLMTVDVMLPSHIRVYLTGFGIVLLTRKIVEEVPFPFNPELKKGEDFLFFYELDRLGIPVIMDTRVKCAHLKFPIGDERNKLLDFANYKVQVKDKLSN